ncbi:MAG: NAD(P)/FAD-dependent oxidoreductase, partial [Calditrichaeota bacterium]|nr:NAD(P)/FAD-dependent oxidoreductase [Calditrichota bacterium]
GWERRAPGLKTIEDALEMRRRIFQAFESAEREPDPDLQAAWLTFLVIGGGPTGVELAGALAELAYATLKDDFRRIDPRSAKIILLEGSPRILSAYPETLSQKARRSLEKLGVEVRSGTLVVDIRDDRVTLQANGESTALASRTVLWGAGVQAAPLGAQLAETAGVALDNIGRVTVDSHLNPEGHPEIFVIGDLARCAGADGAALPGVAPVAMQQGRYAARMIRQRLRGRTLPPFRYVNKGNLAVIGRNAAVADLGYARFSGWPAWLVWVFVHIAYLIEYDNRVLVLFQWAMNYITRKRGARLITGERLE